MADQPLNHGARCLRLLVADDNQDAADSLAELLCMAGGEVRVSYDGSDVLAIAEEFRPDVCVCWTLRCRCAMAGSLHDNFASEFVTDHYCSWR